MLLLKLGTITWIRFVVWFLLGTDIPPPPYSFGGVYNPKTPGSAVTRKWVNWGQESIPGQRRSVKLTNNGVRLTQLWVIFRVKLMDFRVNVDPEWRFGPNGPSSGSR